MTALLAWLAILAVALASMGLCLLVAIARHD